MERMIRRIAVRKDGTISMSEFRNFAEKCQGEIDKLEEENKKLKDKVRFLEECLDRKEKVNKSLREELSAYDREYFDEDKKAKNIFIDKSGKVIKGGEFTTLC